MHPFDQLLLAAARTGGGDLLALASEAFQGRREDQLTVSVLIGDFRDIHTGLQRAGADKIVSATVTPGLAALVVDTGDDIYTVSVWPRAPGISWIVGVPPFTDERWRRVERWVRALEPRFATVFLDEDDFAGICEALAQYGRIEVSRMTARVLADGSSYTRGWPEDRIFVRPTYEQALAEVAPFATVRTLTLHVDERLSFHLRRVAGATYYSGDFDLFVEVVLGGLTRAAERRLALFVGRERRTDVMPESALALQLSTPAFREVDSLQRLLAVVSEQRGLGVAVLHRNPYVHLAITDYIDGSNYDVFVTSDSELVIFPGFRATVGSLARTADTIGERFAAVSVSEVPAARPPTREELFTTG